MTLISILVSLLVDRLWERLPELRHYGHFHDYAAWIRTRTPQHTWDNALGVMLVLGPLLGAVGLVQYWLDDALFGLLSLLFAIAMLIYCLGPRDLGVDVEAYCSVCDGSDVDAHRRAASNLLDEQAIPPEVDECNRAVTSAILVDANVRMFSVLFWFALLGPLGAALYRSAAVLYQRQGESNGFRAAVIMLHDILAWLPARVTALAYAVAGHFERAIEAWKGEPKPLVYAGDPTQSVLLAVGLGALDYDESDPRGATEQGVRAAMSLVRRTLIVWLFVIAILTLAGWTA